MGLDMYLMARLSLLDPEYQALRESLVGQVTTTFNEPTAIEFEAIYWRKANAIHRWFVTNCQNGVDECQETEVSRQHLEYLLSDINRSLADPFAAETLLPPGEGFFFGNTDMDIAYVEQLERTRRKLTTLLADERPWRYFYQSSW